MNGRSRLAMRWNIELMPGVNRYLWTFTTWTAQPVRDTSAQWSIVSRRLVGDGFMFVRAYELHETHGLHIHTVADDFYPLARAYMCIKGTIFGNIDVTEAITSEVAARYISKYISKATREPALNGMRLWACCGFPKAKRERVKDVTFECPQKKFLTLSPRIGYRNAYREYQDYATGGAISNPHNSRSTNNEGVSLLWKQKQQ